MNNGIAILVTIGLAALTALADYFLKLASSEERMYSSKWFVWGTIGYGLCAIGAVYAFRHLKMSTVGVVYSLSIVLLLTLLGVVVFGESLSKFEAIGLLLGFIAIVLLWRFN